MRRAARHVPSTLIASAITAVIFSTSPAHAEPSELPPEVGWNYNELDSPRAAALGGALRAFSSSTDSLFVNPANMAFSRVYHVAALASIWPEPRRQSYGAAAVDSVVSRTGLAGGLAFTWTRQDPDGIDRQAQDLRFALAFPFSEQFLFGIGGRYLTLEQEGDGPLGSTVAQGLQNKNIVKEFTFDAGLTFRPTQELAIALVGNNVNDPGHGYQPSSVGGAIGFGTDSLTLETDVVADFTTYEQTSTRAMAGFEFLAGDFYPLRVGYRYDEGADSHTVSGGVGYVDRQLSAEVAVRRVVVGDTATAIIIGFKYHLESAGVGASPAGY